MKTANKVFRPAIVCRRHLKAGWNTQQQRSRGFTNKVQLTQLSCSAFESVQSSMLDVHAVDAKKMAMTCKKLNQKKETREQDISSP